jgi:hypothetical protein
LPSSEDRKAFFCDVPGIAKRNSCYISGIAIRSLLRNGLSASPNWALCHFSSNFQKDPKNPWDFIFRGSQSGIHIFWGSQSGIRQRFAILHQRARSKRKAAQFSKKKKSACSYFVEVTASSRVRKQPNKTKSATGQFPYRTYVYVAK